MYASLFIPGHLELRNYLFDLDQGNLHVSDEMKEDPGIIFDF